MKYSPEQEHAIASVLRWTKDGMAEPRMTLGGYAGTGKTTIIKGILSRLEGDDIAVCAFTGKAAYVLRSKGVEQAQTIHSLIYSPSEMCSTCGRWSDACMNSNEIQRKIKEANPKSATGPVCARSSIVTRFGLVHALKQDLVIVDEASMLNRRLMEDLEMFGIKVLYVGDHGQLQPIGDDPGLMESPDLRLERIHRQAAESSVIKFAHGVRSGRDPRGFNSDGQVQVRRNTPSDIARYDVVLCGFNRTRVEMNKLIRDRRRFSGALPAPGERVVCLRNDRDYGLFNGMQATVMERSDDVMTVVDDSGVVFRDLPIEPRQFNSKNTFRDYDGDATLWDFGYAMTTHKSQGSEWKRVCVVEELVGAWDCSRWRYTAATRASDALTYVVR